MAKAKKKSNYNPRKARPRSVKRQRQKTMRAVIRWVLVLVLMLALGYGFVDYLLRSPRFSVWNVTIDGAGRVPQEMITAAAGLDSPLNLLTLRPEVSAEKVTELPGVKSCTVYREFPNRVYIDVVEREPVAVLLLHSHAFQIDAEGAVIGEMSPLAAYDEPMITLPASDSIPAAGSTIQRPELSLALELLGAWQHSTLAGQYSMSEIGIRSSEEIVLFVEEWPFELRWGRSPITDQMMRLEELVAQLGELRCDSYLELRFGPDLICG